jgi:vacuolar protein sorting-associated protein 35
MAIYQDEISNADDQKEFLNVIIGYMCNITCLSPDNYDVLVSNVAQFSAKLLKKYDQCLAVLKCTHLFFNPEYVMILNILLILER